jgi:hypothetical protein
MPEFADESEIAKFLREIRDEFSERDTILELWDALTFRTTEQENRTGQYVPPPFDKSRTVIKHATGILADRSQFLAGKVAENTPNMVVFTPIEGGGQPSDRRLRQARNQELALNGIYWSAHQRSMGSFEQRIAWSQVTKGVGWYHSYRARDGWALPDRRFFHDPSDEEIARLQADEDMSLTEAFTGGPDGATHAESPESFDRRRDARRKQNAVDGEMLYMVEALPPSKVYWREDSDGLSKVVVLEEIPKTVLGDEWGIVEDGDAIIAGREPGSAVDRNTAVNTMRAGTWTLARIWTRTEFTYYVAAGGTDSFGGGRIVASGEHRYGEVPFWPAIASETDSADPAKKYLPAVYGALAIIPGYNQILTLLSNAAIFNTTPRYVIIKPDGGMVVDPETGEPVQFSSDTGVGIDPEFITIIEGGGEFQQLKIENVDDLINLLNQYSLAMDATLPSDAALGASGSSEPAWGTRLKQAAQNIKIAPLIENRSKALGGMGRMWSRDLRYSGTKMYGKSAPHRRGKANNVRGVIELNPDDIVLDVGARLDEHDLQERLQLMQIGQEQLAAFLIDPIKYYEEFAGSDDPHGDFQRSIAYRAFMEMLPMLIQNVISNVQGNLIETPNMIQEKAKLAAGQVTDAPVGEPAEAGGVRFPGQEMGLTQNPLPDLGGGANGGAPQVRGDQPVR